LQTVNTDAPAALWYDAQWLAKYLEAKEIVARVAPHRLEEFVRTFDVFRVPPDYSRRLMPGFLGHDELQWVRDTIREIPRERIEMHEIKAFGRFVVHDWPAFTAMQERLVDLVSELAAEPLECSYNFLSLYTKMGVCEPHLDAPSAKWTLDICIDQSEPWPISFSQAIAWPESLEALHAIRYETIKTDPDLRFREEVLSPGDAVLFSGSNQWHFRDALPRGEGKRFCDLLFFHFLPRGAKHLTLPRNWVNLFGIPELAEIADIDVRY
jgi:hypothetical protein